TPGWVITIVQAWRLLGALAAFIIRHPLLDLAAAVSYFAWRFLGWPGLAGLALAVLGILVVWRWRWRVSFSRFIARPALGKWVGGGAGRGSRPPARAPGRGGGAGGGRHPRGRGGGPPPPPPLAPVYQGRL